MVAGATEPAVDVRRWETHSVNPGAALVAVVAAAAAMVIVPGPAAVVVFGHELARTLPRAARAADHAVGIELLDRWTR